MRARLWLENLRERGQLEDKCRQRDDIKTDPQEKVMEEPELD